MGIYPTATIGSLMERIPLSRSVELRVFHRAARLSGRGSRRASVVLALHEFDSVVGAIAVPVELFESFQRAVTAVRPPAPAEPSST